jgi:predicted Zn finger-like uncharacterized protein
MSLITRCPACGTMFKVVPDQLRISEGWVRCGHCADVFDASANLQAEASPAAEAAVNEPDPLPVAYAATPARETGDESQGFASSQNIESGYSISLDPLDSQQLEAEARALRETPLDQPFELRRQDDGGISESPPGRFEPVREPEPELHDLSFVREARSQEFWGRPGVRAVLVLLLVGLALLLAVQVGVHDRDRLAATHPALRPWLAGLCGPLNCRISPPRQIDTLVIDSSSFNKLRSDAYRLNFTVKNQAPMPVAMPALELTLTDVQDQPLVRRVLTPAELGATAGVIAPAAEWSGSVALAVSANGSGARIAGYRLLAFYP